VGNGGIWGAGGERLGTPAFINVPNQEVLTDKEIEEIYKEITVHNTEQVR